MMSKTLPTTVRFSSATSQPIFGGFSVFIMMLFDGVTLIALPILCKFYPFGKTSRVIVNVHLKFLFLCLYVVKYMWFLAESLFNGL